MVAAPEDLILTLTGQSGICAPYNEFIREARRRPDCEAVVLLHEDAQIIDPDFRAKALAAVAEENVGVVGVIGGSDLRDHSWWHARRRAGLAYESHRVVDVGHRRADVDVVDGLLTIVSPAAFRTLLYDEENFPRFHGYEVDYCLQVRDKGMRVVVRDIDVMHRPTSWSRDREDWKAAGIAMAAKWPAWIRPAYPGWWTKYILLEKARRVKRRAKAALGYAVHRLAVAGLVWKVRRGVRRARGLDDLVDIAMTESCPGRRDGGHAEEGRTEGVRRAGRAAAAPHRPRDRYRRRGPALPLLPGLPGRRAARECRPVRGAVRGGYPPWRRALYRSFPRRGQTLRLVQGDSHDPSTHARVIEALGGREVDLLFVDGDHTFAGVSLDFADYGPLVREGGTIAFHDIVAGPAECVGACPASGRNCRPLPTKSHPDRGGRGQLRDRGDHPARRRDPATPLRIGTSSSTCRSSVKRPRTPALAFSDIEVSSPGSPVRRRTLPPTPRRCRERRAARSPRG